MKRHAAATIRPLARPVTLAFLLLFANTTLASEVVGKLQFVVGEVKAIAADGSTRLLKKGDSIHIGEIIKSAEGGSAQVIMQDQNRLVVRTDTELKVKEFKFDPAKPEATKAVISLQQGAIRSFSGPADKGKTGNHFVETPLATVGVGKGDREIIHIKSDTGAKALPAGTFSKVYMGDATVESSQGKLTIGKHQVGRVTGMPGEVKKPENIAELPRTIEKKFVSSLGIMNTAVHKGSDGKAVGVYPDVAKTPTPAGPVPIPYPNIGMGTDTSKGSKQVKINSKDLALKNSSFKSSIGNEAGIQKGLVTDINKGKTIPKTFSMDVKVEGTNVVRSLDMTTKNHQSSAPAGIQIAPSQTKIKLSP